MSSKLRDHSITSRENRVCMVVVGGGGMMQNQWFHEICLTLLGQRGPKYYLTDRRVKVTTLSGKHEPVAVTGIRGSLGGISLEHYILAASFMECQNLLSVGMKLL